MCRKRGFHRVRLEWPRRFVSLPRPQCNDFALKMIVAIPSRHSGDSFPSEPSWMHVSFRSHPGQNRNRIFRLRIDEKTPPHQMND
jgi:hypothetical protein